MVLFSWGGHDAPDYVAAHIATIEQRPFDGMVLNDFVMNPGPGMAALTDVVLSESAVEVTARSKKTAALLSPDYGLMSTFVDRWRGRLGSALASGAGEDVKIPPGNEELVEILKRYNVM